MHLLPCFTNHYLRKDTNILAKPFTVAIWGIKLNYSYLIQFHTLIQMEQVGKLWAVSIYPTAENNFDKGVT